MTEFDEDVQLYKDDPEAFERKHRQTIEDLIQSVPEKNQLKLRQIQWKVDSALAPIKNPTVRMNKMVEIFWGGFADFQKVPDMMLSAIQTALDEQPEPEIKENNVVHVDEFDK